jgi:hypothetical protein
VLKMAKKRAHVDAVLTATVASDIFTQDVEDMPEDPIKEMIKVEPAPTSQEILSTKDDIPKHLGEEVTLKPVAEYDKGMAIKCPQIKLKIRPKDDCEKCESKRNCAAWGI